MLYFDNLPKIDYTINGITAHIRNLFYRLELTGLSDEYIKLYRIEGTKRLDIISFELYGTVDYWWILAIINDIQDIIFDIPIQEEILQQVATDKAVLKYGSISEPGALAYRSQQLELLITENDDKRLIRVINEQSIGRVITEIMKSL